MAIERQYLQLLGIAPHPITVYNPGNSQGFIQLNCKHYAAVAEREQYPTYS